jgi:hypothetical protein
LHSYGRSQSQLVVGTAGPGAGVAWPRRRARALIAAAGEQMMEPGKAPSDPGADQAEAVTILEGGRVLDEHQRQAEGVGDQMALAALDLLAGIKPRRPPASVV